MDKRETVVFVKLDEYKDLTDIVSLIKSKLKRLNFSNFAMNLPKNNSNC